MTPELILVTLGFLILFGINLSCLKTIMESISLLYQIMEARIDVLRLELAKVQVEIEKAQEGLE